MLERQSLEILRSALDRLETGFAALPSSGQSQTSTEAMEGVLLDVASRLHDNYPYFHPLYAGQMLKPPHPVARIAYAMAMWINPNNHALDGGRASSAMEREAVADIAGMVGWEDHLGHLCGGGTMANLEALWVAGQLNPDKKVVASQLSHYTQERISAVLGLQFEPIPCDPTGVLDIDQLHRRLQKGDVGTVVATIGTTGIGSVDPLPEILELRERFGFRLHADAAYGGYFDLIDDLAPRTRRRFDRLGEVDSIVIDPHKHGLQPYGCGCIIFKDPSVGRFYKHESPYTYFTSADLHLGEISLECSRPGAAAVALWATHRLLPLVKGGEFARMLTDCRSAAKSLHANLQSDNRFVTLSPPELDIVVWTVRAASVSEASEVAKQLFKETAEHDLHLALAELPSKMFDFAGVGMRPDRETVTCLRSVLMKPEHREWMDRIWQTLDQSATAVIGRR